MSEYGTILVTTDFSPLATPGVEEARRLANRLGSRLVLVYVVEDKMPPVLDEAAWSAAMKHHRGTAERRLESYANELLGETPFETAVATGRPPEEILRLADEHGADLVVMASHGYGLVGSALLGSTTMRVLHGAECPVVVVRSGGRKE